MSARGAEMVKGAARARSRRWLSRQRTSTVNILRARSGELV